MGTRSLQASSKGIEKANLALAQYALSQNALAEDLGLSRQTVNNFFKGKPIDRENFALICDRLGLDLENTVAVKSFASEPREPSDRSHIDALVQEVRQKVYASIQKRCGTMRVLDMEQPISLDSIYTKVNILEKVSRNQRRTIAELVEGCDGEDFDRFTLGRVSQKRIPGLEAVQRHDKLLILGKPGAGKTTFLKWLAIQCNEGQLHANRVPMFITLKEFAEQPGQPTLQTFICSQFEACGIDNAVKTGEILLQEGQSLVLLDGLDEVRDVDHDRVLQEICNTSAQFHTSQFVITCRIAAREYTFQQFTEVEVADFDDEQIVEFSHKWFDRKDLIKAKQFPKELEAHQPLKELATNPLLLTLLCLVFEDQAEFPANRAELYKEGLDVLLKKWDAKRNIKRDEVYKDLSLKRKEDLLSQIAFITFERSEYFFKQKVVEQKIEQYIRNLPNASNDPEALQIDSEAVLKSIEAQHGLLVERARGIYSFSHLTFHEYFTARRIEKHEELHPFLVSHLTEKRWREVVLLTVGMLEEADSFLLLMKAEADQLLADDEKLQQFLRWVNQKAQTPKFPYKASAIRAFYYSLNLSSALFLNLPLDRVLEIAIKYELRSELTHNEGLVVPQGTDLALLRGVDLKLTHDIDRTIIQNSNLAPIRDVDSILAREVNIGHKVDFSLAHTLVRTLIFDIALTQEIDIELKHKLQQLREELPDFSAKNQKSIQQWWLENYQNWTERLRLFMIQYCNVGQDWQFTEYQKMLLRRYFEANKLIVDCLNSDCYVSREVREEIEACLFLPLSELMRFKRVSYS